MQNPLKISVVIPAYNNGPHIHRSIDSVLAQTASPLEIIVVDDGSTDNTSELVKCYGEKVRYIYQENAGASAARNTGVEAVTGDWIAFLDADDEWLPMKLEAQLNHLKKHPDLQWMTGNYMRCLCAANRCAPDVTASACDRYLEPNEIVENYLLKYQHGFTGHTDTMLIQKSLLIEAGQFRPEQKRFNDLDCWLRIAYRQPVIGFLREPLAVYHMEAQEGLSVKYNSAEIYADLIHRHLQLSAQYDRQQDFKQLAAFLLSRWMRGMLFRAEQINKIHGLLKEFAEILPSKVKTRYYFFTICPRLTMAGCHLVSKVVRFFGLRKKVVRKRLHFGQKGD
jgi:glycosyltransferase involved in cell wall biosynthesis